MILTTTLYGSVAWHKQRFLRTSSTVRWKNFKIIFALFRSWSTKITSRARCVIISEVTKEPRVTFKLSSTLLNVSHTHVESTIRRTLNNYGVARFEKVESHCSLKRTLMPVCSLLQIFWTSQKSSHTFDIYRFSALHNYWHLLIRLVKRVRNFFFTWTSS